ncbi:MAG: hypothetical protein HKN03_12880 [Acidimicrobiales bacterium]|nr:hypothetical protein [Acidimicrobiales bacterium]
MDGKRQEGAQDTPPPGDHTAHLSSDAAWDDVLASTDSGHRAGTTQKWARASSIFMLVAVPAAAAGFFALGSRYYPEVLNLRGADGEPPSILAQPDQINGVESLLETVGGFLTRWPNVLIYPVLAGVLIGLIAGLLRWRFGRSAAVEVRAGNLQLEQQASAALLGQQSTRLEVLEREIEQARHQVSRLTGELADQSDQVMNDTAEVDRLTSSLEAAKKECARLASDLEDALAERDQLETQVSALSGAVDAQLAEQASLRAEPNRLEEMEQALDQSRRQLDGADDLIRRQHEKIEQLETHLDRVRRRAAEMASEVRNVGQLRAAWAQAEDVIVDLRQQLEAASDDQREFTPQSAANIVSGAGRFDELERLLTGAADQIESLESQLRQTRFQLSERDAALARADMREESLRTEISLLTEEISQAAYHIATLEDLGSRHYRSEEMIAELRVALGEERDRTADLARQLSTVSARALRLEERLVGPRSADRVLDLTDPIVTPA